MYVCMCKCMYMHVYELLRMLRDEAWLDVQEVCIYMHIYICIYIYIYIYFLFFSFLFFSFLYNLTFWVSSKPYRYSMVSHPFPFLTQPFFFWKLRNNSVCAGRVNHRRRE